MKTLPSHFWFSKINFSCTSLMEPICWTPDLSINNRWILILKNQWSCFWFRLDLYLVKKTFKLYIRNKWWSLKKAVKTSLKSLSLFTVFLLFLSCMDKFVFFFITNSQVFMLPWYMRKAAAALFAEPPTAKIEDALKMFLKVNIQKNIFWI